MSIEAAVESGRRLVATSLLDHCTVQRRTLTPDTSGGKTEAWGAVATAVACRFGSVVDPDPTMAQEAIHGPRTTTLLVALGQDIRRGDRVVNEATGSTWLVFSIKTADSNLAVVQRIQIREV